MHKKLQRIYEEAEFERENLLQLISNLPEDKLFRSPGGKWSVSQILSHIIEAERISLSYMKKKSLGIAQTADSGLLDDFKFFLLTMSQRLPLKYKAPKVLSGQPPPALPYPQIVQSWNEVRSELKSFMETFDDRTIKRKIYKHLIAGRLNVIHAVKFFIEHLKHHLPQIKRLL
jgi:hypothetical protein